LRAIAAALVAAAEKGLAPRFEVDEFLSEQAALHATGDFFQMWFCSIVTGTV